MVCLILTNCWERQTIAVAPPTDPFYRLYGTVIRQETGLPVRDAKVKVTMTELYQGEYLEPQISYTDSSGYYEFEGLYRARYAVRVTKGYDWLFDGEVGLIEYADKKYNIVIVTPETNS